MKKIIAFAGSNSSTSINHKLVSHIASTIDTAEVELIKLTDYPLPIFGEDLEKESGYPSELSNLLNIIKSHDALIISVNEHNGGVSAFFKNTLDWLSRIEYKFLEEKKVFLLSASPGKRGALSAREYTKDVLPRYGAEVVSSIGFPSFSANFSEDDGIANSDLSNKINEALNAFLEVI